MNSKNNILDDIKKLIFPEDKSSDHLMIEEKLKNGIENFVDNPNEEQAKDLYEKIKESKLIKNKENIFDRVDDLLDYEKTFKNIIPRHRDHYRHSLSVYLLGLGIYNSCKKIRSAINEDTFAESLDSAKNSFLLRWSLTACLHDSAYPLELTLKAFNQYSKGMHKKQFNNNSESGNKKKEDFFSFASIQNSLYKKFNILPIIDADGPDFYKKKDTALGLIANRLANPPQNRRIKKSLLSYETLVTYLNEELDSYLKNGRIDHGIFSAIILLNRAHELYSNAYLDKKKKASKVTIDWPTKEFYCEVVDAATAIFLHNFYKFSSLKNWFGKGFYKYNTPNPLGFLLFFCDTLCEWLREDKDDITQFRLYSETNSLKYIPSNTAKKNINKSKKFFAKDLIVFRKNSIFIKH
ncbi:MAG: hypothetical protein GY710_14910 [Desulfobacteraceae bacterium]|nr:hypothetical protein [Desulfobacteraceae bacterium]